MNGRKCLEIGANYTEREQHKREMKTPMQEHIAYLNGLHEIIVAYYGSKSVKKIQLDILSLCISNAKAMLEKEKEVIMDAHIEGQRVFDKFPHTQWTNNQSEQYYNETFNTKEK